MLDLESASFSNLALATGGLSEDILAVIAGDHWLGMAKHNIGLAASSTLHIHEVGVRSGDESLEFVGLALLLDSRVQEVSVHVWMWIIIINNWLIPKRIEKKKGENS